MRPIEHTFLTFRVSGDRLVPDQVTNLLGLQPTLAYAKGMPYQRRTDGPSVIGRTGVWFFCTDSTTDPVSVHLGYLLKQLSNGRLQAFKDLLRQNALQAVLTCFWSGPPNKTPPILPDTLRRFLQSIPIAIEIDFAADTTDTPPHEGHTRAAMH
jgi:hypothetical protein